MDYKAHLFLTIKEGLLLTSRMQCGRHLHRNSRGTFVLKTSAFIELAKQNESNVCSKCLSYLKEKNKY